ncbi:MAG: MBL fold metallo-hydrolase [Planctomycetota bacterium]|nr:MAG: MBL fold metallo-hydrolase [Planctomycetota bacterium]
MNTPSSASLTFHGAAGTVTGSRFLVATSRARVLLDCGLFQGGREMRERNWADPPFAAKSIDAVVLTHAHLDHSGYLPALVRRGFRGPVHCTRATRDLLDVLLHDAARIEEEDAAYANRKGFSRHRPALPLFESADVDRVLRQVVVHSYHEDFAPASGLTARLRRSGHILGSATVCLTTERGTRLLDTGDLGRWNQPILRDPEPPEQADVLLVESTYGDRVHPADATERLALAVREAVRRGGPLLIPAFAVGRTQTLIWLLRELEASGRIPTLPVYIDSPMAHRVSEVTCHHHEDLDEQMRIAMDEKRCPLCCKVYHLVETKDESIALNDLRGTFILIAGSGMLTGGRMLHHLRQRLPDERTTVLITGFQPKGTPGRQLQERAEFLRIHGMEVRARAHVEAIDGLSAHADQEDMMRWLTLLPAPPRQVYVIHGESRQATGLADAIRSRLGWPVEIARDGQHVALDA